MSANPWEKRRVFCLVYTKEREQVCSQVLNSAVQMLGARGIQRFEGVAYGWLPWSDVVKEGII